MALSLSRPSIDKRLVLSGLLLLALAVSFWTGSRYPALNEKAAMGADAPMTGLAFSQIMEVPEGASLVYRLAANAANWTYTNRQGMTFGVLFATVILMVLPLLARVQLRHRWSNTILGVVMGAPLGVCINCATPIAHGIHAAGARAETTLATLFSSPTLNVIVLTMTLALFPLYLAGLKIGLTLAFILIGVPLLLWRFPVVPTARVQQKVLTDGLTSDRLIPGSLGYSEAPPPDTWMGALGWTLRAFPRTFWYVLRTTVPLMLLAGVLGAIAITVLPWERLVDLLPQHGALKMLIAMGGVALLGTFLPVPMAFDVILGAVLYGAGVPVEYVAVLIVTLGVFSVYPFMVIWRTMSRAMAVALFLAVAATGVGAGIGARVVGDRYETWQENRALAQLVTSGGAQAARPVLRTVAAAPDTLLARLTPRPEGTPMPVSAPAGITVTRAAFRPAGAPGRGFTRIPGAQVGLDEPVSFSVYRLLIGISENRAVASGDVHNDGWPDLVMTSEAGVTLYANEGGQRFVRQAVDVPRFDSLYVTRAALVDVTGDGWLDLYVATWGSGTYVVANDRGRFSNAGLRRLPNTEGALHTSAVAFGDPDRDGDLDVALGNEVGSNQGSWPESADVLLLNGPGGFTPRPLPGLPGETLSLLFSDLDGNGTLDLLTGNDFAMPDVYAFGDGRGGFTPVRRSDGVVPYSTVTTMSFTTADLDNDLVPEIFAAQIARQGKTRLSPQEACADLEERDRRPCVDALRTQQAAARARLKRDIQSCLGLPEGQGRSLCVATLAYALGSRNKPGAASLCAGLASGWPLLARECERQHRPRPAVVPPDVWNETIRSDAKANVLLVRGADGRYAERAGPMGLGSSGWTWNATFADVDHDTWQDLFVANGFLFNPANDRNLFFRNRQGRGFDDATDAFGLGSWLDVFAYTYVDYDRDGDLDIVMPSQLGPVIVYRNEVNDGRSLTVALRDEQGNPFGIGSKVFIHYGPGAALHQVREVRASGGFASFDEPTVHFGLGPHDRVARIEVEWSTGERSVIEGAFQAGAAYVVTRRGTLAAAPGPSGR